LRGVKGLKISNIEEYYGKEYPVDFFPPEIRDTLREYLQRALNGETCSVDTPANDTEGNLVWFTTTFVPVIEETGQVKFVIAASVDITEEVQYRTHLEQLVIERTKEKTELQEQLFQTQKTEAIGSLAAGIAHDFNNILGMILGNVELQQHNLKHGKFLFEDSVKSYASISKAIHRAKDLTGQLLGFAREGKYDPKPIDVNTLILEMNSLLQKGLASTRKCTCKTDLQATNFINADVNQIHQVVQNLVVNARDAMPHGGVISINTKDIIIDKSQSSFGGHIPKGEYVVISVVDHGMGIEKEVLNNIFDPFFTTKDRQVGTGLGLSSVWGIVTNHNGYVDVTSNVPKGTVFDIYFPAVEPKIDKGEGQDDIVAQVIKGRVLFVEDEEMIRNSAKEFLTKLGCDVAVASNGEKALDIYKDGGIELVITDLLMEPMDGFELFDEIRKLEPEAVVYLMSGYHQDEKVQKVLENGAKGFLKKPFRLEEIKKVIQESLPARKV